MIAFIKSMLGMALPDIEGKHLTRRQKEIEQYLSLSVDWYDLERREKELERKGYFK